MSTLTQEIQNLRVRMKREPPRVSFGTVFVLIMCIGILAVAVIDTLS